MLGIFQKKTLPDAKAALPGRATPMPVADKHFVKGTPLKPPFPAGLEQAIFGLGCFWGAEQRFWKLPGVYTTAVGYAGGLTPNPNYREVCSGKTGHTEAVLVVFDPGQIRYESGASAAENSRTAYASVLSGAGFGAITTEIRDGQTFYYAEDAHQQYLAKNPLGYCGLGGTGVPFPEAQAAR